MLQPCLGGRGAWVLRDSRVVGGRVERARLLESIRRRRMESMKRKVARRWRKRRKGRGWRGLRAGEREGEAKTVRVKARKEMKRRWVRRARESEGWGAVGLSIE